MAERYLTPPKEAVVFHTGAADSAKEATAIAELYQKQQLQDDIFNVALDKEVEMKYPKLISSNQYLNL